MKFLVFVVYILFVGCAYDRHSSCAFDLKSEGWRQVEEGFNQKIQPVSDSSHWYSNTEGDYLICYEVTSDGKCHGIYERFTKQASDDFVNEEIVCMD